MFYINNNEIITGIKQFRHAVPFGVTNDNGNEFGLFGSIDNNDDYDPTFVGIIGNYVGGVGGDTNNYPSWNKCGMDIKSNGVRFYDSLNKNSLAMVDCVAGKIWSQSFCIRDASNTVINDGNVENLRLDTNGLSSKNNLSIFCTDSSSNMTLSCGYDMSISAGRDMSLSSSQNTTITSGSEMSLSSSQSMSMSSSGGNTYISSEHGTTSINAGQNLMLQSSQNTTITSGEEMSLSSSQSMSMSSLGGNTTIDASQNIFIGTNSQGIIIGNYNISRNGNVIFPNTTAPGFLTIGKSKNSFQQGGYKFINGATSSSTNTDGSANYSIVAADRIGCSELNAFSDLRLKENVDEIDISEAMNLVKNIKPVTFDWKDSKQQTSGFIAQDILKNGGPTHLVSMISEHDLEETVDSDNFVSPAGAKFVVNYNGFIPYYHKVIKNLVERIEELEKKN